MEINKYGNKGNLNYITFKTKWNQWKSFQLIKSA